MQAMAMAAATACADSPAAPVHDAAPAMVASHVTPNPFNVLSATVAATVRGADSVAVRISATDGALEPDILTPFVRVQGDSVVVPILGLEAGTSYSLRAVAVGGGRTTTGPSLSLRTDALPDDLPSFVAGGPDPSPGYVVFVAGTYGLVIDNSGRVVWYRSFPDGPGLNFIALASGHYAARPATPAPDDVEPWIVMDPLGRVVRTVTCGLGLRPRVHELVAAADGSFWLLCDDTRTMDLTSTGGVANARVTGTAVHHVSADGSLLFAWTPFDHFDITDLDPIERTRANVNWTHANALDFDADGHVIVSFRNLGEITKIDRATGAIRWRMGGKRNQFTFLDTPLPAFSGQHSARLSAPNTLLLLDNLGDPLESRAERYVMDEAAHTARLVNAFVSPLRALTLIGGSAQLVSGDRTLVSFGTAGRVEEYDAAGRVVWQIAGNPGYVFRAQRIASLYAPGVGTSR
jgi:hypothetical protein